MTALEKFKRRMIRSVARLLQEKMPEDELWDQMKKETGCDCRLLWERMRALTLKKLRRLLLSDDKSENVPSIARMSLTDWLLFDLVLVHEKIDFIERDILETNKEIKPLIELFYLVQKFQIESMRSNALADAWTAATVIYNSRGHQCSPMLLQRRWYQLKEATRERFYNFWFKYRGNAKQLPGANQFMPSRLQAAIAKRYNDLITKPFIKWEKMIEDRLVILPDEFESKMRNINFKMPSDNNDPELILVEPVIETIDLGAESDSDQQEQSPPAFSIIEPPPLVNIKKEPKATNINDVNNACDAEILRAMNKQLPQKVLDATSIEVQALLESENETLKALERIATDNVDIVANAVVSEEGTETSEDSNANNVIMPQISNVFGNVTIESLSMLTAQTVNEVVSGTGFDNTEIKVECLNTLDDYYPVENDMNNDVQDSELQAIPPDAEQIISNDIEKNNSVALVINSSDDDSGIIRLEGDNHLNQDMLQSENTYINQDTNKETDNPEIPGYLENAVDNTRQNSASLIPSVTTRNGKVEKVIDLDEDICEPEVNNLTENNVMTVHSDDEDDIISIMPENISKFVGAIDTAIKVEDFPVDTCFGDDGIEFVDDGIEFVDEDADSNSKTVENNIQNLATFKIEVDDHLEQDEKPPKFDLKLLLNPIVYTKRLDDLSIFKNNSDFNVKSKDLINHILKECKPLCDMSNDVTNIKQEIKDAIAISANDDLINDDDNNDEPDFEEIPESYKVKVSSYLLQKPRSRTYNPIQLCKNPDFNTRLKRLSVGFFSLTRNCQLMKCCKPMTIDLNKTFENKLINGTLYLKPNNISDSVKNDQVEEKEVESEQTVSVLPSALAAQSLIDNTTAIPASNQNNIVINSDFREIVINKPKDDILVSERSRVINLPDISQVRLINQKLQTAEVTPIQVQHAKDTNNLPVQLVTNLDRDSKANAQGVQLIQPNISKSIKVPDKPASEVVEVDNKPIIMPDQNQPVVQRDIKSSNASKIDDFIKQIEATGSEIAKADQNPDIISSQVNDKTSKEKNPKLKNSTAKCYKRSYYPEVSWLSVKRQPIMKDDDSLLTLDTLNKMLNIINGDVVVDKNGQFQYCIKKKKNKTSNPLENPHCDSKIEAPPLKSKKNETATIKSKDEHIIEKMRKTRKPKIKIISKNQQDDQKRPTKNYCRKSFLEYQEKQLQKNSDCVLLSDDDDDKALHNACESIERVVRQTYVLEAKTSSVSLVQDKSVSALVENTLGVLKTPVEVKETPAQVVEPLDIQTEAIIDAPSITDIKTNDPVVSDDASILNVVNMTVVPASCGSTVMVKETHNVLSTTDVPDKKKQLLKHTVQISTSETNTSDCLIPIQPMQVDAPQLKRRSTARHRTLKKVLPESYYQSPPNQRSKKSLRDENIIYKYQAMHCSCRLPSVSLDSPKRRIVIDGSVSCAFHNQISKNIKHKVLLMNSKSISREPSERPISLGRNKILLTTVKLSKHSQPAPELSPIPQVIPAMPLPSGVQLILLPHGELTYYIDPSVQLTAEQISSIPIIMAAVKQQLDSCAVAATAVPDKDKNNDVVNISDDESATSQKDNVDVENHIEKYTINDGSINIPNNTSTTGNNETPQPTVDLENVSQPLVANEYTNSKINEINDTVNENIIKETNENVNKETNNVGALNDDISTETKETHNVVKNLSETNNRENNVVGHLDAIVNKENNAVGGLDTNLNKENNVVGGLDTNDNKENNDVVDQDENVNKENNIVRHLDANVNKENNVVGNLNEHVDKDNDSENAMTSAAARKTILSDLMEMSGISAEDTVNTLHENVITENIQGNIVDNVTIRNLLHQNLMPIPPLVPLNENIYETDIGTATIPELTPITSLSELKYACEQDEGQFFKLDLDTGVLIPINVCIKKHVKPSSSNDKNSLLKPLAPKQVMIDLTDDNDIIVQEKQSSKPMIYNNISSRNNFKSLLKSSRGENSIKPVKIFRSVHPNMLRKQYGNNLKQSKVCVELDQKRNLKRKRRFSQIEAKIDLVDSDAPMEEEYLMDSFEDSVDSSDDEPLASIAKRNRAEKTVSTATESDKGKCENNDRNNALLNDTSDISTVRIDTTDVPTDITHDPAVVTKVPSAVIQTHSGVSEPSTDIVLGIGSSQEPRDEDINEPPQITFLSDDIYDSEASQEDSILGV